MHLSRHNVLVYNTISNPDQAPHLNFFSIVKQLPTITNHQYYTLLLENGIFMTYSQNQTIVNICTIFIHRSCSCNFFQMKSSCTLHIYIQVYQIYFKNQDEGGMCITMLYYVNLFVKTSAFKN